MSLGYRLTVRVSSLFWNLIYDVLRGRRFAFIESGADSLKFLCCVPLVSEDVSSEMPSDSIRFVDVATFRAPRLGGVIILGSFQSLRAGRCRAFSVSLICPEARACRRHILCRLAKPPVSRSLFVWQNDRHHASRFAFLSCAHPCASKNPFPAFLLFPTVPPNPSAHPCAAVSVIQPDSLKGSFRLCAVRVVKKELLRPEGRGPLAA